MEESPLGSRPTWRRASQKLKGHTIASSARPRRLVAIAAEIIGAEHPLTTTSSGSLSISRRKKPSQPGISCTSSSNRQVRGPPGWGRGHGEAILQLLAQQQLRGCRPGRQAFFSNCHLQRQAGTALISARPKQAGLQPSCEPQFRLVGDQVVLQKVEDQ